ncbi:unnamed protein product [Paramecium sonneborni]|uniref:Uncharacterized protein n=1 Tax=Paramecium sonneborni TaxID=65129 RepID=A0A8S1MM88_9CILI|nr:unnamed protein product [Paramecium sonneborni]
MTNKQMIKLKIKIDLFDKLNKENNLQKKVVLILNRLLQCKNIKDQILEMLLKNLTYLLGVNFIQ